MTADTNDLWFGASVPEEHDFVHGTVVYHFHLS